MAEEAAAGAVVDSASLKALLAGLRDLPPKVRTNTRRELRALGQPVIDAQRAILDGPLPGGVAVTGQTKKRVQKYVKGKPTGKFYVVKVNTYATTEAKERAQGRSTGLREGVKGGLKFRIVTGATRQGIEFKTTGPKLNGYNSARFWNSTRFRHPVFNTGRYAYQAGQHYMVQPVLDGKSELLRSAEEILSTAVKEF